MEIGTTISAWKFDEKNKKIKRNKSKNTQKNNEKFYSTGSFVYNYCGIALWV